ncbi:MBL fold metallo-hydrolase [Clostridium pasteurianum]|uniref:Zn-dependent hydrolase, glyoxylase n=1 Tax=Clostridium pasteurianum BC1 TaxID=86416 RepID=R4KAG5_CLOPA|nr:MBL fold metallo-hydrolase [Clostridium pasteurianum]AGK98701.1 Zn-dependent hydrolase, glyoxylase [Clostridium pasteurianum BC1]
MQNYTTNKIRQGFYSIEQGFVRSFLIEGDKDALLIDTGVGDGNLKEYVEEITKLPVTVIFTHADGDHVGAAWQFERRFMHPCEFNYYNSKNEKTVPMEPIWEGDVIDLGSYCFEVILIPGHTPGSIALLEKDKRFLIGGDSIQIGGIFMFGNGRDFDAYRASMRKLQGRLKEFDTVYASHNVLSMEANTVNLLYTAADKVMENKVYGKPEERFDGKVKCYETDGVSFYAI